MSTPTVRPAIDRPADVALLLEGSYPFVKGGVSNWMHDLICAQKHLTFAIIALQPGARRQTLSYRLPGNVISMTVVNLSGGGADADRRATRAEIDQFHDYLHALLFDARTAAFHQLAEMLATGRPRFEDLFDSRRAWRRIQSLYQRERPNTSFLQFFWTMRTLAIGIYVCASAPVPQARLFHSISTGYAGLLGARLSKQYQTPSLITEHGIYTNERRVELQSADWLHDADKDNMAPVVDGHQMRDLWQKSFETFAHIAYEQAGQITTLYRENQLFQIADGAMLERLMVIPNGVAIEPDAAARVDHSDHPPTIALIGRIVPIKDVEMYIRAIDIVRSAIPDLQALVLGGDDEDPDYAASVRQLTRNLGLSGTVRFCGHVDIRDYFPRIDVLALTSLSEAQPLALLEAGAAGIPSVTTNVGACRELLYGSIHDPVRGQGGIVVRCGDHEATAKALVRILSDTALKNAMGKVMQQRVQISYNKPEIDRRYSDLYARWLAGESKPGIARHRRTEHAGTRTPLAERQHQRQPEKPERQTPREQTTPTEGHAWQA